MNKQDLISVAKGAGIAAAGAALTFITQWASGYDFGSAGVLVAAVLSVATNYVRKYMAAKTPELKAYALRKLQEGEGYVVPIDTEKDGHDQA